MPFSHRREIIKCRNSPGRNTRMGSHSHLHGIFPTQRSHPWFSALKMEPPLPSEPPGNHKQPFHTGSASQFLLFHLYFFAPLGTFLLSVIGRKISSNSSNYHEIISELVNYPFMILNISKSTLYTLYTSDIRSVTQSCPTLCNPMNRSTPGLPVHHQLLDFTQTHVHRVSDAIQPSHPLSSPSPLAPNPSQHQSLFQ